MENLENKMFVYTVIAVTYHGYESGLVFPLSFHSFFLLFYLPFIFMLLFIYKVSIPMKGLSMYPHYSQILDRVECRV
jgi:hypothetical protein